MHRTYYYLQPNEDQSAAGKARFRENMSQLVRYDRMPKLITDYDRCNLVGSLIHPGEPNRPMHLPCWDFDDRMNPNRVLYSTLWGDLSERTIFIPSRTAGHWHGWTQVPMPWDEVTALLNAMTAANEVDPLWSAACLDQGQTFLRKPTVDWFTP